MLRLAAIAAAIAGAALFSSAALAQSPEPTLPVAGPDEIIYVGEVPAPPGTEVTAEYLTTGIVVCGTTLADENSRFVLSIDANCARGGLGPLICWGGGRDNCQTLVPSPGPSAGLLPRGGDTIDAGLLTRDEISHDNNDSSAIPHGDSGTDVVLPEAGGGGPVAGSASPVALALLALVGAALFCVGAVIRVIRRESTSTEA